MLALREIEVDEFFKSVRELAGEAELAKAGPDVVRAHMGLEMGCFWLPVI